MPFIPQSVDELCERAELTQRELADEIGVPQSTVYRWLRQGRNPTLPHLDALYEVAEKYELDIEFYRKPVTEE
tara:strand:- start:486 stop:704 length:219 start_codon:yes stop_codon:yes gene_type:complete